MPWWQHLSDARYILQGMQDVPFMNYSKCCFLTLSKACMSFQFLWDPHLQCGTVFCNKGAVSWVHTNVWYSKLSLRTKSAILYTTSNGHAELHMLYIVKMG